MRSFPSPSETDFANFLRTIDIHHNYAVCEEYFGKKVFMHRKGATSAKLDEIGVIPGSMGAASYIVRGHPWAPWMP